MAQHRDPSNTQPTQAPPTRAILVAVALPGQTDRDVDVSLNELAHLVKGLGIVPASRLVQRRSDVAAASPLGAGKLVELSELADELAGDGPKPLVIFDGELSPGQQRHLMNELEAEVFDRTEVILRVFASRARSRTAQLEVELARLSYEAPRLRDDSSLERQAGGGGRGGQGHTSVTLRKQQIRRRMAQLRQELEREVDQGRSRRSRREGTPRATLVGYTNAGKSSLMRALTGADILVEDALFATLGTTVRTLGAKGPPVLVADTVGFIRNLPNHLLASFRTTLDEALDADLLLHVVDVSDPEWRAQLSVTQAVLAEVGASDIPAMVVFNKKDRVAPEQLDEVRQSHPGAVFVSALDQADVGGLQRAIVAALSSRYAEDTLEVPFSAGKLLGDVHARGRVLAQSYTGDGSILRVRAEAHLLQTWREQLRNGDKLRAD